MITLMLPIHITEFALPSLKIAPRYKYYTSISPRPAAALARAPAPAREPGREAPRRPAPGSYAHDSRRSLALIAPGPRLAARARAPNPNQDMRVRASPRYEPDSLNQAIFGIELLIQ